MTTTTPTTPVAMVAVRHDGRAYYDLFHEEALAHATASILLEGDPYEAPLWASAFVTTPGHAATIARPLWDTID